MSAGNRRRFEPSESGGYLHPVVPDVSLYSSMLVHLPHSSSYALRLLSKLKAAIVLVAAAVVKVIVSLEDDDDSGYDDADSRELWRCHE